MVSTARQSIGFPQDGGRFFFNVDGDLGVFERTLVGVALFDGWSFGWPKWFGVFGELFHPVLVSTIDSVSVGEHEVAVFFRADEEKSESVVEAVLKGLFFAFGSLRTGIHVGVGVAFGADGEGDDLTIAGGFLNGGDSLGDVVFSGDAFYGVFEAFNVGAVKVAEMFEASLWKAGTDGIADDQFIFSDGFRKPGHDLVIGLDDFGSLFVTDLTAEVVFFEGLDVAIDEEAVDVTGGAELLGVVEPPILDRVVGDVVGGDFVAHELGVSFVVRKEGRIYSLELFVGGVAVVVDEDVSVVEDLGVWVDLFDGFCRDLGTAFGAAEFFEPGGLLEGDEWKGGEVLEFFRSESCDLAHVHVAGNGIPAEGGHLFLA